MSKNEDAIERTPEYEAFIQDLREFHRQKGTSLQAEPVLGRKRLDLLKFYKLVLAAGGFEQVTKKRGWKQIGENFRLPSTCTNSAYILKGLYIRNLLGYEEERVWGRTWVPPPELRGPKAHKASTLAGSTFKKSSSTADMDKISRELITTLFSPIAPDPKAKLSSPFSVDDIIPAAPTLPSTDSKMTHNCPISELHHQTQPSDHVHATEALQDCAQAQDFDDQVKQRVMLCLRSQNQADIEWAINKIVIISFESPKKLRLDNTPGLLDLLLDIATGFLQHFCEGSPNYDRLFEPTLKVLHILRNFSFLNINARMLASNKRMKDMLFKTLNLSTCSQLTEMARHCIDILENLAGHIELVSPFDDCLVCLASLLYTDERYLLLGTIRMLTLLVSKVNNQPVLMTGCEHTLPRVTLLLLTQDEELVGTSLEYLYVYVRLFPHFRYQLLSAQHGAFIGILASLLLAKSRYFCPKIIKRIEDGATPSPKAEIDLHAALPCVPNLTLYQQLDEPYRCLGWLKDKFEPSDPSSVLSLDDMYLLYEMRFGKERALKMKEFYTVLKIAFPSVTSPDASSGPVLEGISIRGIQIRMSILQDGAELLCQWTGCTQTFQDEGMLEQHVMSDHVRDKPSDAMSCLWTDCGRPHFNDQKDMMQHVRTHFNGATSCDVHAVATSVTAATSSIDDSEITGTALASAYLLRQLAKDPQSHEYFKPFEMELLIAAKRRPNLAPHIESMFSHFNMS